MEANKVVYTVDEVAEIMRVSRPTAYAGVRSGAIPSIRIGKRLLVPRVALERMLAGQTEKQPQPISA